MQTGTFEVTLSTGVVYIRKTEPVKRTDRVQEKDTEQRRDRRRSLAEQLSALREEL